MVAIKIIIGCAITRSIDTFTMWDAVPVKPNQIATQVMDAANAGAAIPHPNIRRIVEKVCFELARFGEARGTLGSWGANKCSGRIVIRL